jgi:hypothetical protein
MCAEYEAAMLWLLLPLILVLLTSFLAQMAVVRAGSEYGMWAGRHNIGKICRKFQQFR